MQLWSDPIHGASRANVRRARAAVAAAAKSTLGRLYTASGKFATKVSEQTTIVAFHRVCEGMPANDSLTCPPKEFERFCRFFKDHFNVIPLAEQVRAMREGRDTGGTLSITFDDGYRDNHAIAAPILKKLGLPATFFVTSGFIASQTIPFWDRELETQSGWMSWDEVRSLAAQGFEIGCHTHTHIDMGATPPEVIRAELQQSRGILEKQLGAPIKLFAYPFGGRKNINAMSTALVQEEGFDCCISCCGGINSEGLNPFALNRLPISGWFATPYQMAAEIVLDKI